jgi:hypothetical protein
LEITSYKVEVISSISVENAEHENRMEKHFLCILIVLRLRIQLLQRRDTATSFLVRHEMGLSPSLTGSQWSSGG